MKMKGFVSLMPAYGRDYKSQKSAIADFQNGKDFQFQHPLYGNGYCSIRDFEIGATAQIRYEKMHKVVLYQIKEKDIG